MSQAKSDFGTADFFSDGTQPVNKSKRGFANMPKERQKEIASMGGRTAHQKGTAHQWNSEAASIAGAKGAAVRAANRAAKQRNGQR